MGRGMLEQIICHAPGDEVSWRRAHFCAVQLWSFCIEITLEHVLACRNNLQLAAYRTANTPPFCGRQTSYVCSGIFK
eukprot:3467353-Amphidinium_carterae.1